MLINEKAARTKWCPMVRTEGDNRHFNTLTDGFQSSETVYHCIASDCMGWRQFHLSFTKGSDIVEAHGYCGFAGRPELE